MKIATHSGLVCFAVFTGCVLAGPAAAQSIGLWGGWNDGGRSWQGTNPVPQTDSRGYGLFSYGSKKPFPALMDGGPRPYITPEAPKIVSLPNTEAEGTVLIDNSTRRLYYILDHELAYEYPISIGRDGFVWTGTEKVSRIAEWPDWHPPKEMRVRDPRLPVEMTGGIKNPLGAVSIYLGDSLYRIHGTNDPKTIGHAASSGCFRMLNPHALHLASLVDVGTVVKVMNDLPQPGDAGPEELPWLDKPQAVRPAAPNSG